MVGRLKQKGQKMGLRPRPGNKTTHRFAASLSRKLRNAGYRFKYAGNRLTEGIKISQEIPVEIHATITFCYDYYTDSIRKIFDSMVEDLKSMGYFVRPSKKPHCWNISVWRIPAKIEDINKVLPEMFAELEQQIANGRNAEEAYKDLAEKLGLTVFQTGMLQSCIEEQ